jgi:hypothetical protein
MAKKNIGLWFLGALGLLGVGAAIAASIDIEQEVDNQFASVGIPKYTGWRCLLIILWAMGYNTPARQKKMPPGTLKRIGMALPQAVHLMKMYGLRTPIALLLLWGVIAFRQSASALNTPAVRSIFAQLTQARGSLVQSFPQQLEIAAVITLAKSLLSSSTIAAEKTFLSVIATAWASNDPSLTGPLVIGPSLFQAMPVPLVTPELFDQIIRPEIDGVSLTDEQPIGTGSTYAGHDPTAGLPAVYDPYMDMQQPTAYNEPYDPLLTAQAGAIDYGDINSPGGWDSGYGWENDGGMAWGDVGYALHPYYGRY